MPADSITCESDFTNALCSAAWDNRIQDIELLIAQGAEINELGIKEMPPLYDAVENCSLDGLQLLLQNGARVDSYGDPSTWTSLAHAVESAVDVFTNGIDPQPYIAAIVLLFKYGANPEFPAAPLGRSPVQYAADLLLHDSTEPIAKILFAVFLSHAANMQGLGTGPL